MNYLYVKNTMCHNILTAHNNNNEMITIAMPIDMIRPMMVVL
jgi:hypothetical protein